MAYRIANVGKTGILKVKKSNAEQVKYRPDLGDVELDLSSELNTNTTGQFNTITGGLLESCDVKLEPIQDLHGYDKPWVGGSGKNKLQNTRTGTTEQHGLKITSNDDGSVFFHGGYTASVLSSYDLSTTQDIPNGSYILNGCPSGGGSSTFQFSINDKNDTGLTNSFTDTGSGANVTISNGGVYRPRLVIRQGYTIPSDGLLFKPMLRLSTVSDATFEPYTNICGITGHSSVEVDVCGENLFNPNKYEEIDLTGTGTIRYGHEFGSGDYTLCQDSGSVAYYYRLPTKDLSNRGSSVMLISSPVNVTVDDNHLLWVFAASWNNADGVSVVNGHDKSYVPYNGTDYTISLGQTVYSGSLDVVSGVLTVDKAGVDMGSLSWTLYQANVFTADVTGRKFGNFNILCSMYPVSASTTIGGMQDKEIKGSSDNNKVIIKDSSYSSDASALTTAVTGQQLVYELATPITIQLTPQQINTLIGENHIDVPLEGQTLDSAVYRELFAWDDVEKAIEPKADISAIGTDESGRTTASRQYATGERFYKNGKYCKTKGSVAQGATWTLNTNYEEISIADDTRIEGSTATVPSAMASYITIDRQTIVRQGAVVSVAMMITANNMPSGGGVILNMPFANQGTAKFLGIYGGSSFSPTGTGVYISSDSNEVRCNVAIPDGQHWISGTYIMKTY